MKSRLHARLAKLEAKSRAPKSASRVVIYSPKSETVEQALLRAGTGSFMFVVDFGSFEEWKRAALEQQAALQNLGAGY